MIRFIEIELTRVEVAGVALDAFTFVIPDDAPAAVREGLARQNVTNVFERCPCGVQVKLDRAARRRIARGGALVGHIWHEQDCPGGQDQLDAAIAEWCAA